MANGAAARALADLEQQLVELSRLRNANTRDPDFKVWRQATLTLIQRVWEGDDSRSGRFRAVPFSPASSRADSKSAREWFERGCAEAAHVIRDLIEEINQRGIMKGPAVEIEEPEPLPEDESVPILSLDGSESDTRSSAFADEQDDLRLSGDDDAFAEGEIEIPVIPDPPGARAPKPVSRPPQKPAPRAEPPQAPAGKPAAPRLPAAPLARTPAAPAGKVQVTAKVPAPPPSNARRSTESEIPISETAPSGPSRGVTVTNSGAKPPAKKPLKQRLMDMLGFEPGSQYTPPQEPGRRAAPPAPSAPAPAAPQKSRPAPTHAARPAAPAPRSAAPAPRPVAPAPRPAAPPALPPDSERRTESFGTIAPESVAPLGEGRESGAFTPTSRAPRPGPPRVGPPPLNPPLSVEPGVTPLPAEHETPAEDEAWTEEAPSESEAERDNDEDTLKRAFEAALAAFAKRRGENSPEQEDEEESAEEDLLESSPVFNVTARPVKRRGSESEGRYHTATGIAMAAIATEVEAMGVPGPNCARTRAALLQLADHFERRDLTWDVVRDAVRLLIEYPVVARRVLPLLVPHLDEAA